METNNNSYFLQDVEPEDFNLIQSVWVSTILRKETDENFVEFNIPESGYQQYVNSHADRINTIRDDYYSTAIQNLLKKVSYLQLMVQFSQGLIDEEEFKEEIRSDQNKFVINLEPIKDVDHIHIVFDILKGLNIEISENDACELFSIDPRSVSDCSLRLDKFI